MQWSHVTLAGVVLVVAIAGWRSRVNALVTLVAVVVGVWIAQSALATADTYTSAAWNSARAVVPVALAHGVPPYFPPGEGPLWASIYPPMGYLLYTPIALLRTPTAVIQFGQVLNLLFLFVPLAVLLTRSARTEEGRSPAFPIAVALLLCLTLATVQLGLSNATYIVHVDPPAIGLALAACVPLVSRTVTNRAIVMSAVLASASLFCKQTMLPVGLVLPVYLAITSGRRAAGTFLAVFLGSSAVFAGVFLLLWSPSGMFNNLFLVPAAHPLRDDHPRPWVYAATEFYRSLGPLVPLAVLATAAAWVALRKEPVRNRLTACPAFLLLVVAAGLLPTSLAGFAKFGGFVNNFAASGYFLLAAFGSAMVLLLTWAPQGNLARWAWVWRTSTVLLTVLICADVSQKRLADIKARPPRTSPHQTAFYALQAQPGRMYFPWLPLSHFLADGSLTHQSFGIWDREKAGQEVTDRWLWQYIPADAEVIAFDTPPVVAQDRALQRLSETFSLPAEVPALRGWTAFARPVRQPTSEPAP
jgi:hypothetical protein